MSLKDIMAQDALNMFNEDEFAERVLYNSNPLLAVIDVGPERASGNTFTADGEADRANIMVLVRDVPEPQKGDIISAGSKTWEVARVLSTDSATHLLECIAEERPRWG